MMFRNHYGETVTVVLAMMMGLFMSLASIFVDGLALNFSTVFSNCGMITLNILIWSILLPYNDWSAAITRRFCKEGTLTYKLVANILPSIILNTVNTFIVSAANIFFNAAIPAEEQFSHWFSGALHDWPIMFVISYFAAFAAEAVGKSFANRFCKA